MKSGLALGGVLLVACLLAGCASGASSRPPRGGSHCLSRPDTSGTQPLIYLLCIQSG